MSDNKLKIRIQIHQPQPQAIEELYPEPEVTYEQTLDWNRIAIAALLSLSFLALIGYLLFADGGDEKEPVDKTAAAIPIDAALQEKAEPQLSATNDTSATQTGELIGMQKPPSEPVKSKALNNSIKSVVIPARKPPFNSMASPSGNAKKKSLKRLHKGSHKNQPIRSRSSGRS